MYLLCNSHVYDSNFVAITDTHIKPSFMSMAIYLLARNPDPVLEWSNISVY